MTKVKLKARKPVTLAYIEHVGKYDEIPYGDYFLKLYAWSKENKVRPGFKPLSIFYDCPEETAPENLRSEIAIPIKGSAHSDTDIKIKELSGMQVAAIKHKGPAGEYKKTYGLLREWVTQNGYECNGPFIEVYTKKPKNVGGKTILYSEIQAPVKKK